MADTQGNQSLEGALTDAFAEATSGGSAPEAPPAEAPSEAPEPADTPPEPAAAAPEPAAEEETGDVLLDKLTPDEIAAIKSDPKLRKVYAGLMKSYTPKMQDIAEKQKLWDALNNPDTRRQATEALARAAGFQIAPEPVQGQDKAEQVADGISEEWSKVVGPEAAQLLRPLIEKTALMAVQGTLGPLQQSTQALQMDAKSRQAEAQVSQFRTLATEKKWNVTPQVEAKMAQLGQQLLPAKPIETVSDGVKHLEMLYRLASSDTAEADMERRILDRMKSAAQSAEPGRGVPSTGREKRTNITREMSLNEALDVAMKETLAG